MNVIHKRDACGRFAVLDDDARVPPVCICACPSPNAIGECFTCKRPYKPEVPGFDACRDAWLAQLAHNKETAA